MSEVLQIAVFNLISNVGLNAAISIIENMRNAKTIDDAIVALKAAQTKTWEDFKKE